MNPPFCFHRSGRRRGWSILDVTLVVVIAGGLFYLGTSHYLRERDEDRMFAAVNHLSDIHRAQAAYHQRYGRFADRIDQLDLRTNPPVDFDVSSIRLSNGGWSVVAERNSTIGMVRPTRLRVDQSGWNNVAEQDVPQVQRLSSHGESLGTVGRISEPVWEQN
ncbi:MAG: hypothetical protein AAF958_02745 [Planctomycetota bacterium]